MIEREIERVAKDSYMDIINACRDERMEHPREYLKRAPREIAKAERERIVEKVKALITDSHAPHNALPQCC